MKMKYFPAFYILFLLAVVQSLYAQKGNVNIKNYELTYAAKMEETKDCYLTFPEGIFIDTKKNICVKDNSVMDIKVFDKNLKLVKIIGRKGNGPGEFKWIGNANFKNDGSLIVNDLFARRISVFDKNYKFFNSFNYNAKIGNIVPLKGDNYLAITEGKHSDETQLTKYYFEIYDKNFKILKRIDSMAVYTFYELRGDGFVFEYFNSFYIIKLVNDNILFAKDDDYQLRIYSPEGKMLSSVNKKYNPVVISAKEKNDILEKRKPLRGDEEKIINNFRYKPAFSAIFTDNKGKIFVKTYEESNGKALFDVFDFQGKLLYKALFPKDMDYNKCVMYDGYMYFLIKGDKTNPPSLCKYKIIEK